MSLTKAEIREASTPAAESNKIRYDSAHRMLASETLLELALEAGQLGFWDWNIVTGEVALSEQWARMLGRRLEDIEPHVSVWEGLLHPDDEPNTTRILNAHLEGKTPYYESEHRLRHSDGSWIWVLDRGRVIERDAEGKALRAVGTHTDITKRKAVEHLLHERDVQMRALINVVPEIVWSACPDGRLEYANQKWYDFVGPERKNDVQETFLEALHPEDAPSVRQQWLWSQAHGASFRAVMRLKNADGIYRWFRVQGEPARGEAGEIANWFGIATDITEQREAEAERERYLAAEQNLREEAELANKSKDDFLAMLSHELRSPLNAIYGWIQILERGEFDKEKVEHAIDVIGRNVRLQKSLIEDLLDISRIVSGKIRVEMEPISLNSVVRAAVDAIRPTAEKKGIDLQAMLNLDPDEMQGDRNRMLQVVGNILTNAVKYTHEGGTIRVALGRIGNRALLTISDDGEGIDRELLPKIFGLFKDGGTLGKRKFGGMGLGLTLVKFFVELHGGTVSAASEGSGKGATFKVDLPLVY